MSASTGARYDEETKAEALALSVAGHTGIHIANELGVHFTTVYRWLDEHRDVRDELAEDAAQGRLLEKAQRLYEYKLDQALEDPGNVTLVHAAVAAGISDDKSTRRRQLKQQRVSDDTRSDLMRDLMDTLRQQKAIGNPVPQLSEPILEGEVRDVASG